jgi:hypothetical protein
MSAKEEKLESCYVKVEIPEPPLILMECDICVEESIILRVFDDRNGSHLICNDCWRKIHLGKK